jgi:hypothetical protein
MPFCAGEKSLTKRASIVFSRQKPPDKSIQGGCTGKKYFYILPFCRFSN